MELPTLAWHCDVILLEEIRFLLTRAREEMKLYLLTVMPTAPQLIEYNLPRVH